MSEVQGKAKHTRDVKRAKKLSYVTDNHVFLDRWRDTLRAGRELYGHTVQSVAARSIVHKFLERSPAWIKPGFIVSFTSGFDQLKI